MQRNLVLGLTVLAFMIAGLGATAVAEDEPAEGEVNEGLVLAEKVKKANEEKDSTEISGLCEDIITFAKSAKTAAEVDPVAVELVRSLKVAKGNWGTLRKIIAALGELRSKPGSKALKKLAFQKKPKDENYEELQATALIAISLMRDPKLIEKIADQMKSRSIPVAKAAMAGFKNYSPAPGKTRKKVAEVIMKRMQAEKPSAGQGGGVSAEAQKRWQVVSPVIVETMQAICRQPTISDVDNWDEWWRENKKKRSVWKDPPKE
ncbi:MAG: hypothetical protein V3T86_15945 [Planctomycetota bacterium]